MSHNDDVAAHVSAFPETRDSVQPLKRKVPAVGSWLLGKTHIFPASATLLMPNGETWGGRSCPKTGHRAHVSPLEPRAKSMSRNERNEERREPGGVWGPDTGFLPTAVLVCSTFPLHHSLPFQRAGRDQSHQGTLTTCPKAALCWIEQCNPGPALCSL